MSEALKINLQITSDKRIRISTGHGCSFDPLDLNYGPANILKIAVIFYRKPINNRALYLAFLTFKKSKK